MNNGAFHVGEIAMQKTLGVDQRMAELGPRVIRDFLPAQHQQFYQQLPLLFVGHVDAQGHVWASVIAGKPGFIEVEHERAVHIHALPVAGDPLLQTLADFKTTQQLLRLGFLGLESHSRRRNRFSADINAVDDRGFSLAINSTFGNCPKYIEPRQLQWQPECQASGEVIHWRAFDQSLIALIQTCDTFFVASATAQQSGENNDKNAQNQGADISHRGGEPGFVRVDNHTTLTIPDYPGNRFFNTLGNFLLNPQAGLLFVDFDSGDIHSLSGRVEIINRGAEIAELEGEEFEGAERLWRFYLERGITIKQALPLRQS